MRDLTFVCAFFENQGMLREQQKVWREYPKALKPHFHTVVTDDLSPHSPARDVFEPSGIGSQQLYLALEHRRWDWLFARNLGVEKAATEWVLLTDIDHVVPTETLRTLLTAEMLPGDLELDLSPKGPSRRVYMPLDPNFIFRFSRVDARKPYPWKLSDLPPYKAHPNSWLMTRAMFDRMGGYDERFSGFYGSDSDFRERCKVRPTNANTHPAEGVVRLDIPLVRYPREIIPDASTTTYERKASEDGLNVPRIKSERSRIEGWRPLRLTIPFRLETSC